MSDDDVRSAHDSLRSLSGFSREVQTDYQTKIDNISSWVDEQKRAGNEENIKAIGEALKATVNALEKFKTGDPFDIACGTLDVIASVATVAGGPYGAAIAAFCGIAGAIVSANRPGRPSVVEQLAEVFHSELVSFNDKLQQQTLSGLQRGIQRQLRQLQKMRPDDKLVEPNLWDDLHRFLAGELLNRVTTPLPFKYDDDLEKDPEVADFMKALVTYCRAYTCFMALLMVAKVKFDEFGNRSTEVDNIEDLVKQQKEIAKENLSFLSEEKHLTFLGRLPSESGSLTKILLLSRNPKAKDLVEETRRPLGLSPMPKSAEVEEKAKKVFRQSVRLKYSNVPEDLLCVQFFNETDFAMRVVSGEVGWPKGNLKFVEDINPRSFYQRTIESITGNFSIGGYMKIAYNGKLSPEKEKDDPYERDAGIIEFAMSRPFYNPWGDSGKNNIQDMTDRGRTKGQDTYNKMTSGEEKIIYWKKGGKHYLAECENRKHDNDKMKMIKFAKTWRFIVQEFDPVKDVQDESVFSRFARQAYDAAWNVVLP